MRVALGLGCSLGDRRARLELTLRQLDARPGLRLLRVSRWRRSPPMRGGSARGWFLNGVALLDSALTPSELLELCQGLESEAGRRRRLHWADRPLDLDLLVAEDHVHEGPRLRLPHRAIGERSFVLYPLLEVWPDAIDARTGTPYAALTAPPSPPSFPVGVVPRRLLRANRHPRSLP